MKTRPWISVSELDNPTHIDAEEAVQAASFILFSLSGQKYAGLQSVTEQYFCHTTGAPVGCIQELPYNRYYIPGFGYYAYQGIETRRLRTAPGSMFRLNHRPVVAVTSVTVGGHSIDPDQFVLYDGEILSRGGYWGLCDSPVITYTYGVAPPALGKMACRQLANELILSIEGSTDCKIPSNVTSINRQGVSFTMFDPQDFMDKGRTGLYVVDMFLASVNPSKAKKRPKVFSPDFRRGYGRS